MGLCRQGPVCSVRFHEWGRGCLLRSGAAGHCTVGAGGFGAVQSRTTALQGRLGGRRQPGAATQLLSARTAIAKAAKCAALQSHIRFKYTYKYGFEYGGKYRCKYRCKYLPARRLTKLKSAHCKATILMLPDSAESREMSGLILDLSCL